MNAFLILYSTLPAQSGTTSSFPSLPPLSPPLTFVAVKAFARARIEEQVPRKVFKDEAGQGPHVRTSTVRGPDDHLRATVLACLNILRKVLVGPACVAQVEHLDLRRETDQYHRSQLSNDRSHDVTQYHTRGYTKSHTKSHTTLHDVTRRYTISMPTHMYQYA